tara:strand:+ start:384 stop:896 length:513 start_codon:yes stop_codon:yes gene_type:complete
MPLTKLQFRPGINRETTSYSNEGGWVDGDKIRFRFGFPEKIGGWTKYTTSTYLGTPRSLHAWVSLSSDRYLSVGTSDKYYIESGGSYNDITPVRLTVRQPFEVSGESATTGVGVVTILPVTDVSVTGTSATGGVGTVNISIEEPIFGTTGVGTVTVTTVNGSSTNVPVGG